MTAGLIAIRPPFRPHSPLGELIHDARKALSRCARKRPVRVQRAPNITDAQLDALEERGYLDPDRRGDRADEKRGDRDVSHGFAN
jgi:hypothetical protein